METSNKIKWTNVPVDLNVAYLKRKIVEAFDGVSKTARVVRQEIDNGRIDRAKQRLSDIEKAINEFKNEVNS
tara:strand:+ start:98 stop:313 length:216 start_codon:yes stop_codon:yes gene_type:complete